MADPVDILKTKFGFDSFRGGQLEAIEVLLAGRSAAAIFPTGSGKSLCYQLTALMLPGLTLVVSPLLALMKDQIDSLQAQGIEAERLDSSLTEEKYREVSSLYFGMGAQLPSRLSQAGQGRRVAQRRTGARSHRDRHAQGVRRYGRSVRDSAGRCHQHRLLPS